MTAPRPAPGPCACPRVFLSGVRGNDDGFSLVEALVALAVVSFGALSAVALQLQVRRVNAEAAQRALAAHLAQDLAERLRASSADTLPLYFTGAVPLGRTPGPEPQPDCSAGAPCSPAQLAAHERWAFALALDGAAEQLAGTATDGLALPSACVGGSEGNYTLTLAWRGAVPLPGGVAPAEAGAQPATACGADPQADGAILYSRSGSDNAFRRTLSLPLTITAPPRAG